MNYSKHEIEGHFEDILKLQCFVNGEREDKLDLDQNFSVAAWIKRYEFSQVELATHLIEFYQINERDKDSLLETIKSKQLIDLIEFIELHGIRTQRQDNLEKHEVWDRFLQELNKKAGPVGHMRLSDEISPFLRNNLSDFVYAFSKIAPGRIDSFSTYSIKSSKFLWQVIFGLILIEIFTLVLGFFLFAIILLIPLIIGVFMVVYMQKRYPENININGYITFQDMLDDITQKK